MNSVFRKALCSLVNQCSVASFVDEISAENSAIVNLNDMMPSTIATIDLGDVTAGDRILVNGICTVYHSSDTAVHISIQKESGSATIRFGHNHNVLPTSSFNNQGTQSDHNPQGICKVMGSGNLVLKLCGITNTSGSANVPAGFGEIYGFFLIKH